MEDWIDKGSEGEGEREGRGRERDETSKDFTFEYYRSPPSVQEFSATLYQISCTTNL